MTTRNGCTQGLRRSEDEPLSVQNPWTRSPTPNPGIAQNHLHAHTHWCKGRQPRSLQHQATEAVQRSLPDDQEMLETEGFGSHFQKLFYYGEDQVQKPFSLPLISPVLPLNLGFRRCRRLKRLASELGSRIHLHPFGNCEAHQISKLTTSGAFWQTQTGLANCALLHTFHMLRTC